MFRKTSVGKSRSRRRIAPPQRRRNALIALAIMLGLVTSGVILAKRGITQLDRQAAGRAQETGSIGLQGLSPDAPSKEYIYGPGGRIIATEEPSGSSVPPAPTGLSASAGNTQVSLSWIASSGATSYKVKRSTTNGGPYSTIASGVTTTTYPDSGLTNGTTYYYVVSALNGAGESGNSNQASATPSAGSNKINPVGVTASNQLTGNEATKAIDGDLETFWNSGGPPTQWIQLDLGQNYSVTQIRLNVRQTPDSITNHEIYGGPQSNSLTLLRQLNGFTQTGQWLQVDFSPAASNIRYVKVNTTASQSWVAWTEIEVYGTPSGGGCGSFSISPTSVSFQSSGGTGNVSVTAGTGCSWSAVSNDSWITITSGSSGSGNGTVGYSVSSNPNTSQRTGTMTIAGLTFTVTQAGVSCSYSINPTSQTFQSSGGTGGVAVTATAGCGWTATSNNSFITITSGSSGTGNGTVNYSVASNPNTSQRTGTMTIAGLTFTVTQSGTGGGANCDLVTMTPSVRTVSNAGGAFTVDVTNPTPAGCNWTATSNVSWITITSGGSGSGAGTISYTVAAYSGGTSTRSGKITINANSTPVSHTVKQTP